MLLKRTLFIGFIYKIYLLKYQLQIVRFQRSARKTWLDNFYFKRPAICTGRIESVSNNGDKEWKHDAEQEQTIM